ncbi:MAG: DNA polymerase III subunit beta [Deltaproteobacteria bacterium]|nr:DNA polymerase III subunit beta [Deltaproteobacteria bacterium]MBW2121553.1 DNA polymerase III subunit beta [Deltaproteobacteria bacterium]
MECKIEKRDFLRGLTMLQTVVERRTTMPILSNALLHAENQTLTLTATDLETAIQARLPASVTTDGQASLSARKLFEIVRELPESPITLLTKENDWVTLTCQKSVFNIAGMNPDEFPPLPDFREEDFHPFPTRDLREMIEATVFAASTEESRYNLNGVFLKGFRLESGPIIRMVATDGHRLSLIDKPGLEFPNLETGVIIPRKGLLEIRRLMGDGTRKDDGQDGVMYLALSQNNLVAKRDEALVFTRLIEGQFPDYESVIPKDNDKRINLPTEAFTACLKRVSTMASEKGEGLVFEIGKAMISVSSFSQDFGDAKEEIDIEYDGDELAVGFNGRYLLDALGVMGTEEVLFELRDNSTAGVLRPVGREGLLCLVMPMKL